MPAKNVATEKITLRVNDGSSMNAYVARPAIHHLTLESSFCRKLSA